MGVGVGREGGAQLGGRRRLIPRRRSLGLLMVSGVTWMWDSRTREWWGERREESEWEARKVCKVGR